ncbi:hypothetical protein KQX54_011107 [Cotesia glomerata]|uniref:Peptidase A2 domain-containing protein n=1 Tax=Cotesia glomerata TaxID=32391 RepID=A0AAV7HDZ0_COTGL|nr:hypothetical protein KQX54_011107 [Cotesia glomerata]
MITDITIGPFHIEAMLDSGSERSYISETAYNRIQGNEFQELSPDPTSTVGVTLADPASTYTRGGAPFKVELDGKTILTWLNVLPRLSTPVILGLNFWQSADVHVESKIATWYLGGNSTKHQFRSRTNKTKPLTLNALSSSERSELSNFLTVEFDKNKTAKLGVTNLVQHRIEITDEAPVRCKPYRRSQPVEMEYNIEKRT